MKAREFLQKGNVHLTRLEFQQALDAYTECLLCDPSNRTAKENIVLTHNNWGIYWFGKRKYKEAREEWEQALKLNPSDRNARTNLQVLKITLSRLGVSEEGEKKPAAPKTTTDFPPSQVIILTPGFRSGGGSGSGSSAAPGAGPVGAGGAEAGTSSAAQASSGAALLGRSAGEGSADSGSGAAVIIKSGNTSSVTTSGGGGDSPGGISTYTNRDSANPFSTGSSSQTGGSSSGSDSQSGNASSAAGFSGAYSTNGKAGKFTTAPATVPAVSAPATAGGSQGENIEDSLAQIEQKIYGRKQDSLPIMKRLEKLETDTHGKTKSGTIKERIDTLRKSYGF